MQCFNHDRAAVGVCAVCQKALCHDCVVLDTPRLVCRTCMTERAVRGFEYRSAAEIGGWPLVHVCLAADAITGRPRVARGIVAIGNMAVGVVAIAGLSFGLLTVGGVSVGLIAAFGGLAAGLGVSVGGLAIGAISIGGAAVGFVYAVGGAAFAPAVIDGRHCDVEAAEFVRQWFGSSLLPPSCGR